LIHPRYSASRIYTADEGERFYLQVFAGKALWVYRAISGCYLNAGALLQLLSFSRPRKCCGLSIGDDDLVFCDCRPYLFFRATGLNLPGMVSGRMDVWFQRKQPSSRVVLARK